MSREERKPGAWPSGREVISSGLNSYSQIFFSDNRLFGGMLLLATFLFPLSGLAGLGGVLLANLLAFKLGYDREKTIKGLWGFNVLLTTLPLGLFFEPGVAFWVLVAVVSLLTFMVTIAIHGVFLKYQLPYLSMPFVLVMWILILSTREFDALQINSQNIYQLNELYGIGGTFLVGFYEWVQSLNVGEYLKTYLLSLSAIFFQNSLAGGLLIAIGLLISSRISFLLSVVGFSAAFGFYGLMGIGISEADYTYIGFNYMLTAIAIGGFYHIATKTSFMWVIILTPIVALFTVGFNSLLLNWQLSVYALPFNVTTILFIYVLKWRYTKGKGLQETPVQRNSPEKNLYAFVNYSHRFENHKPIQIALPFYGEWLVSQGHDGEITHRGDWRHAWDFVIVGEDAHTYRNQGDKLADFLAYDTPVLAPVDGYVVEVIDGIPDNPIGQVNLKNNWGNTIIIKIAEDFYAKLSHLKKGSMQVSKGDWVYQGTQIASCGNSGRSPEPHIHFQLQETPYVDARTVAYPIAYYQVRENDGWISWSFNTPEEGGIIRNPEPVPVLKTIFDFVPGQRMHLQFTYNDHPEEVTWEIQTTPWNESYIECLSSGSKAFYQMDGKVFYFIHFEGNRRSPLYYFYLAFFQRPLFYGKNSRVNDRFPPNQVFGGSHLIFQDFLAPFAIYLVGNYETNLPDNQDLFGNEEIIIQAKVNRRIFDQNIQSWLFESRIDTNGVQLSGSSGSIKMKLSWEK